MTKKKLKYTPPLKDFHKKNQRSKDQGPKFGNAELLGLGIVILLGIIIYSNSFNCSFHLDDMRSIVDNIKIRDLSDVNAWWTFAPSRPLGYFTFALNYHFNQLDVTYYHIGNLMIHLINACLVYWLTWLIFSSPALKDHVISKDKKVIVLLTALLFVSHPLATQSVTYIVQRLTSMAALFYLLSLAFYVKARLSGKRNTLKYFLFAGSLVSAVLAMLTKENTFTLPFAIVLFEIFFLQTKKLTLHLKDYRILLWMATFLGLILIVSKIYSFSIFNPIPPALGNTYTVTPVNYFFTQFNVIVKYIQLLFLPINQNLDYDFPIANHFFELRTLLSFLLLVSLIILAIYLFKKNRLISFGIFWFFLALSIESSFIPLPDLIFEHRTYLPSFGFFLILSSGLYVLLQNKQKYLAAAVLIIIIGSNSFLTYQRNKVWQDDLTLWNDVISKSPHKARPIGTRGDLYRDLQQWDNAIADYSGAIEINPEYAIANHNRGGVYGKIGQWDKAIADYTSAIKADPKYSLALYNRGNIFGKLGQWDKAIEDYGSAIAIDTKFKEAYYARSVAFGKLKQWDKAITDCDKAINIDANYGLAYFNRGFAYSNL